MFHVPHQLRVKGGALGSTNEEGNNGLFRVPLQGHDVAYVIASDGDGWEHVSFQVKHEINRVKGKPHLRIPSWYEMNIIKDIFWDKEDCVMQLHPPKHKYVNISGNVLHLWRPVNVSIPQPPMYMVGPTEQIEEPQMTILTDLQSRLKEDEEFRQRWIDSHRNVIVEQFLVFRKATKKRTLSEADIEYVAGLASEVYVKSLTSQ